MKMTVNTACNLIRLCMQMEKQMEDAEKVLKDGTAKEIAHTIQYTRIALERSLPTKVIVEARKMDNLYTCPLDGEEI